VVKAKPELANMEPFRTVLSGDREAIAKLSTDDLLKTLAATLTGMSVDQFKIDVKNWLAAARDPRWKRHYTELTYLPMLELLKCLRANGYKTYIVTGAARISCVFTRKRSTGFHLSRSSGLQAASSTATPRTGSHSSPRSRSCC